MKGVLEEILEQGKVDTPLGSVVAPSKPPATKSARTGEVNEAKANSAAPGSPYPMNDAMVNAMQTGLPQLPAMPFFSSSSMNRLYSRIDEVA